MASETVFALQGCDLQLQNNPIYPTRSTAKNIAKQTASRTFNFSNTFFPHCSQNWNNLSDGIKSLPSLISFKKALLSFVKTSENSVFAIHDNNDTKLLTRLRLSFSHLNEQKFGQNFPDSINTIYFLLRCENHIISRSKLLKNIYNLDQTLRNYNDDHLTHTLLYGTEKFNVNLNKEIIKLTVRYLRNTERFNESQLISFLLVLSLLLSYYFIASRR